MKLSRKAKNLLEQFEEAQRTVDYNTFSEHATCQADKQDLELFNLKKEKLKDYISMLERMVKEK